MPSTFSNLGLTIQATGENPGEWGLLTNVNLQRIDNAIAGVITVSITGNTTLAFSTNSASTTFSDEAGRNKVIVLSGSLSATTVTITVPNIEKDYVFINNSGGTATISAGGSTTVSIGTGSKSYVFVDGAAAVQTCIPSATPGGSNTQVQFNSSGAFGGSANLTFDGTNVTAAGIIATNATVTNAVFSSTANFLTQSELRFQDTAGGQYIGLKAGGTIASSFTLVLPTATGTANQVIQTDGSGNLSFATVSGGAEWQAVQTTNFTGVAGKGYFINTSSAAITMTLPSSPTIGQFISVIDYSGTFDTNNLTIARNGNKIQGASLDLTVNQERAGLTLVFTDSTQGWLLETN